MTNRVRRRDGSVESIENNSLSSLPNTNENITEPMTYKIKEKISEFIDESKIFIN